jgi:hypothetical protein
MPLAPLSRRRKVSLLTVLGELVPTKDVACLGHGGGHTSWHCRACETVVYGPPLNTHCTTLEGPAAVRISTHPAEGGDLDT